VDSTFSGLVLGTTYLLAGRSLWAQILAHDERHGCGNLVCDGLGKLNSAIRPCATASLLEFIRLSVGRGGAGNARLNRKPLTQTRLTVHLSGRKRQVPGNGHIVIVRIAPPSTDRKAIGVGELWSAGLVLIYGVVVRNRSRSLSPPVLVGSFLLFVVLSSQQLALSALEPRALGPASQARHFPPYQPG
jgi:hypothetical protein